MPLNSQSLDRILRTETTVSAVITSNTAFTLPSAANMAGKLYTIYNPSASTANVLVNAADASLVVTVQPGSAAVVTPISDVPATNAAWMVVTNGVNASGVKGRTDGSAIAAGYVGEIKSAIRLDGSALALSTGVPADVVSLTLTPGVWWVAAFFGLLGSATASTYRYIEFSTTPATLSDANLRYSSSAAVDINTARENHMVPTGEYINISANTTYYLACQVAFSGGTVSIYGRIKAVRIA